MSTNTIHIKHYKSPLGILMLGDFEGKLCMADWQYRAKRHQIDQRFCSLLKAQFEEKETQLHQITIAQFEEYFKQERKSFEIPLLFVGTDFQKSVWSALTEIPFGKTSTYLALSQQLKNELAIRAVASANGANALSIIVPCHRIIGSNGDLVGYAGGLAAKQKLLQLEGNSLGGQLSLF